MGTLNSIIAGRTKKEWTIDNGEYLKEKARNCHKVNKEEHSERNRLYRQTNAEEGKKVSRLYRQTHSEELQQGVLCECGGKCRYPHKKVHCETKKHLDYIKHRVDNDTVEFIKL